MSFQPLTRQLSLLEPISPELVLVDPDLAVLARGALPPPGPPGARIDPPVPRDEPSSDGVDLAVLLLAATAAGSEGTRVGEAPGPAPRRFTTASRLLAAACVFAVGVGIGTSLPRASSAPVLLDTVPAGPDEAGATASSPTAPAEVDRDDGQVATAPASSGRAHGEPAPTVEASAPRKARPSTSTARPATGTRAAATPPRARKPARPGASPRTFVWASVDGADAYDVEFYRGSERIFADRTSAPRLTLPSRWRYRGKDRRLVAGEYRWYVWTVEAGERQGNAAVVQAMVVIP